MSMKDVEYRANRVGEVRESKEVEHGGSKCGDEWIKEEC